MKAVALSILLYAVTSQAGAQSGQNLGEDYNDYYLNYIPRQLAAPEKKAPPPVKPDPVAPPAKKPPTKVDVDWLQKNYAALYKRAIDDPSEVNVTALAYVQKIIVDKAQRFSEVMKRVTDGDPFINENTSTPIAGAGALAVRNANYRAQSAAVVELSKFAGMVVFVDSVCRFCAMQMPPIKMLKDEFGIEALVVSLDGQRPSGYTGPIQRDNGLYRKLGLKVTPSVALIPNPKPLVDGQDPNTYLVVAQGFYSADSLTKQLAYAGHRAKLLSAQVSRDLAVWDYGVTSTEDLKNLNLDIEKPEGIPGALQPLMMKQFDQREAQK
jgi:conjugal transfer pilus assembly protein TraF